MFNDQIGQKCRLEGGETVDKAPGRRPILSISAEGARARRFSLASFERRSQGAIPRLPDKYLAFTYYYFITVVALTVTVRPISWSATAIIEAAPPKFPFCPTERLYITKQESLARINKYLRSVFSGYWTRSPSRSWNYHGTRPNRRNSLPVSKKNNPGWADRLAPKRVNPFAKQLDETSRKRRRSTTKEREERRGEEKSDKVEIQWIW